MIIFPAIYIRGGSWVRLLKCTVNEICLNLTVAAGGVKAIADIAARKPYEKAGIEGVIVGKSIYMGTLDLAEAIEIAAKEG